MAAVKIAIGVLYDSEIEKMLQEERKYPRGIIAIKFYSDRHELWKMIQMKAAEKLPFLPNSLKTSVCKYIQSLHVESEDWIKDHMFLLNLDPLHCNLVYKTIFCWKSDGTINRVKTAKKIAQNKNIDPNSRFILACTYFLEDEVLAIWHGHKEVKKKSMRIKGTNSAVRFWMKWLKKGSVTPWRLMVDDYFSFPCFRRSDIPLRFSSFFPYLSQESRANYFGYFDLGLQCFDKDGFFSYLCEIDEAERTELLQLIPRDALRYCLKWPFQTLFIEMANQLESYMKGSDFEIVFLEIVSSIMCGLHDFDYVELLKEFWNLSPSFKEEIKKCEIFSKVMEAILNYDAGSQSLPLAEIVDKSIYG
ncbi:hypothetical protein AVEN_142562-1 [Araneus ventricosus]|uniref:Uncharacterized protein n=1 Tax=Araneus ventricosus TaxID=182803 RepID=A0A4Y2CHA7_ARAVE|nr:hypothetical protein AVEN_142562-1 [Araneus ventricosus]